MNKAQELLREAGITPTPVRILVFRCLQDSETPLSLSELEERLESVDKSSISRTLTTFRNHHVVHSFNDGSGSMKFEICHSHSKDKEDDLHVHFYCEKCGITRCLNDIKVPEVELPEGYLSKQLTYIVSGICAECRNIK